MLPTDVLSGGLLEGRKASLLDAEVGYRRVWGLQDMERKVGELSGEKRRCCFVVPKAAAVQGCFGAGESNKVKGLESESLKCL